MSCVFSLFLFFPARSSHKVKSKATKEKTKNERIAFKRSVKKATKTPQVVGDNQESIDMTNLGTEADHVQQIPMEIVQAKTDIPAFIGYTEKGSNTPTLISSTQEYRTKFGGGSNEDIGEFQINSDGTITSPSILIIPKYMMYYMLKLYFANGG